ncbi:DUF475 domain-containing protein [Mycobacterium vicinigordonae]|uniref:DUF475 domain-containing protein n=1 Tax=Mycobacterium vicinigordonae TaxID=1719132 RepID=A0A7D6DVF1_9MYCO|nr:DUF475 domain-containing protein [Mycobacterium vicinigordonae]QLL05628.1 DUF475 domain-containing protein [Mycobacterium vicinigordonae]
MALRIFWPSIAVTIGSLIAAFLYRGFHALILCAILGVLEVSLSFDNAVINATVLRRMDEFWQRIFMTIGILVAVFGMRIFFPLLVVWVTAGLAPRQALQLAFNPPPNDAAYFPDGSPSYETALTTAHPQIAAFGGTFLLMLFLNFIFGEREITWLSWLERPLGNTGMRAHLSILAAGASLILTSHFLASSEQRYTVLLSGLLGLVVYVVVDGLGSIFAVGEDVTDTQPPGSDGPSELAKASGKAGFFLFLQLEVLDASFSFDGVIGAFAITADPILIALGLGFIGAMFVRSITIFLVRKGTLSEYVYLEHGAHWAIGALAVILLISIRFHVNEILTGLIGVVLIGAALLSSVVRNRRNGPEATDAG